MGNRLIPSNSVFAVGFAGAVAMWVGWLLTHLPWIGLVESVAQPVVVATWFAALAVGSAAIAREGATRGETVLRATGAGFLSSLLGLLILGSKLTTTPAAVEAGKAVTSAVELRPAAALIVLGFLCTGAVLGLFAGLAAGVITKPSLRTSLPTASEKLWLGRFAWIACVSIVPLIVVGGLVTSTG